MLRFATPYAFLLLALPAGLALADRWRRNLPLPAAVAMSAVPPPVAVYPGWSVTLARWIALMPVLAVILIVAAMARPQWGSDQQPLHLRGIDIMLVLDLSESMAALDFRHKDRIVDRLTAAKGVMREFVGQRQDDRIGLVVFGSRAYTQMPLTHDHGALIGVLDHLQIGAAGRSTAMGDAIGIALKRFSDARDASKVIVLLTDGASNTGELSPQTAAEIAAQMGVRIHSVGMGRPGRAPFPVQDPIFGPQMVYRPSDLDEATLQAVADRSGGTFFRAMDREGLSNIYTAIDLLEKKAESPRLWTDHRELYPYLLAPALILLVGWVGLRHTRYLPIP